MQSVFITGADRGLGLSLCKEFLRRGWRVFAGKYMADYFLLEEIFSEHLHIVPIDLASPASVYDAARRVEEISGTLDMLISNAALMEKRSDAEAVWRAFNVNALGPLRLVEAFLPLMQTGMKRLCFVSSETASISLMTNRPPDDYRFAYPMSKAAMNMGVRLMHNDLFPRGFTFRLFHPGWMKFRLPCGGLTKEGIHDPDFIGEKAARYFEEPLRAENRLVMVDFNGYEWPW